VKHGVQVALSLKYEFSSQSGIGKFLSDSNVWCSTTHRIVPEHVCTLRKDETTDWKPVYTSQPKYLCT
jgi:hypothetical protein